jgi:hypothetical protein
VAGRLLLFWLQGAPMVNPGRNRHPHMPAVVLCLSLVATLPRAAHAQTGGIDPQAVGLLKAGTEFLASQNQISADAHATIEVVLTSGQKIHFDHAMTFSLQRPNKLRTERRGDLVDQVFYYDGKSLTMHNPSENLFATVPAPGTLEEMLDYAREQLDIVAPAGDFLYKNAFDILMTDVTSAFVVGKAVVGGVRCDHLAFRNPSTDWQVWLQEGSQPLLRKLVVTSTDVVGSPEFTVETSNWNLTPTFAANLFTFTPAKDARQIQFLTVHQSVPSSK